MAITLTERAAHEAKRVITQQALPAETAGIKVGLKGGGCSGFSYRLEMAGAPEAGDKVMESHGARIFCDPKSYLYLNGSVLDWEETVAKKGFVFKNPNAKTTCGCGESFSV